MKTVEAWHEVLGVSPFASDDDIRDAYLALVKQWHPDRFVEDPARHDRALEQLKRINAAYDLVRNGVPAAEEYDVEGWGEPATVFHVEPAGRALLFSRTGAFVRAVSIVLAVVYLLVALAHVMGR